jgi:CubicO group peptidase (beta-lactamase class C family)
VRRYRGEWYCNEPDFHEVNACSRFLFLDKLQVEPEPNAGTEASPSAPLRAPTSQLKQDAKLVLLLRNAVQAAADEDGWARVGAVGHQIANQASFDPRNYGYATLTKLMVATQLFELADEGKSTVMVRDKRLAKQARH